MIEDYYDTIANIENFVDAIVVIDESYNIRYYKNFGISKNEFKERKFIGKKPWDNLLNLKKEDSTLYRALKYGEKTYFQPQTLDFENGPILEVLDTTFPIKKDDRIIGAVSASIILNSDYDRGFINLSNMTENRTNDLYEIRDIIGNSKEVKSLKEKINKVSQSNSNVLIYGATGTGKELVAQSIHSSSKRKEKRFISQNCAAIPETLLESIFFGTTKGSYTGAENKPGIFEMADGGTIFLDEINSMNLNMQAKLLKAIEEKKITRIGASEAKKIDVRIIAATNELPHECVMKKKIREDLFYRLSSILIKVPPLKDRKSDIPLLTNHFIDVYNKEMGMNIEGITNEVANTFYNYDWPGNIRELKNTIECAFNFSSSNVLEKEDLPEYMQESVTYTEDENTLDVDDLIINTDLKSLDDAVSEFEKNWILSNAKDVRSLSHLADKLQISRQTLNYKLKKYKLNIDTK